MQKIIPHLWFDKEAKTAAEFYSTVFPDSKVTNVRRITDTPSGDCDIVSFEVMGTAFQAISAGPLFKINPSVSFTVNLDPSVNTEAPQLIDQIWNKLIPGGKVLMPIDQYPFSKRYGWIEDKFGVSWQLILTKPEGEKRPAIIPSIMFTGDITGKAEEATDFYMSVFKDTKRGGLFRYPAEMGKGLEGMVMFTDFVLESQWFVAMDSGREHNFSFSEAVSFMVMCDTQEEIDYYWDKLSAVPESEQCGWLKDRYGLSWQIVPSMMDEMMESADDAKVARITQAFLKMKKFDIARLREAGEGKNKQRLS